MDFELEQIGQIQKLKRRRVGLCYGMPSPITLPEGITDDVMYLAFERVWREINKGFDYNEDVWLQRSDRWGERGYLQPAVHFDWLNFRKGVAFGILLAS